jgi:hypothetical protein
MNSAKKLDACTECLAKTEAIFAVFANRPKEEPHSDIIKKIDDVSFQESILRFYTKGEFAKIKPILAREDETVFQSVITKLDTVLPLVKRAQDAISAEPFLGSDRALKEIGKAVMDISDALAEEAEKLGDKGGAVAYLSKEYNYLSQRIAPR